ncbi:MAG: TetR family transcriptional regulator C-terminal domain-containing protein [Euryarchaeota archaeon]|nr:TetR family transcriptional regulator C-terminal domain-containing protein [Euryarchaeota archaeon]
MAIRDEELKAVMMESYVGDTDVIRGLVETGIAKGEFRAFDSDSVTRLLYAAVDGALIHSQLLPENEAPLSDVSHVVNTLIELLKADDHE